jgi:predicted small lipoprotein YifL
MRYGVLLLLALLLGACGLKGDLYLPEPEKAATSPDQQPPEAGDTEDAPVDDSQKPVPRL